MHALVLALVACGTRTPDPIVLDPPVLFVDSIERDAIVHVHGAVGVIGGLVLSGTAFESANTYVWHVRLDNDGTIKWRRQYDLLGASAGCCVTTSATTDGSLVLDDDGNLVVFDASGFVVTSGTLPVTGRGAATLDGGLLVPLGPSLATISSAGAITGHVTGARAIAAVTPANDGGLFAFGALDSTPWFARLDAGGVPIWQLEGGPPAGLSVAGSIEPTADGGALVLVNADPPWLARLDPAGTIVWQRSIRYTIELPEAPDALRAVEQADGTVIVFGRGNTPWVVRLDASGAPLGDRRLTRSPSDAVVIDGEAVIFGQFEDRRGLLYRPRDLAIGPCGGGLLATNLEVVEAAETLAPTDVGFAIAPPPALQPTSILSRASDLELSTACP